MHILVTGATGFVGRALCSYLHEHGHELLVISRSPQTAVKQLGVPADARGSAQAFKDMPIDAIINLAGEPIFDKRWSRTQKKILIESRVSGTRDLVALCQIMKSPPRVLISGSAMGYYGAQSDREVTEGTPPSDEFAYKLCKAWEDEATKAAEFGVRVARIRIGLVLDREGGMLKQMLPAFRIGLGGKVGAGNQYMPWVHRSDLVRIIDFLLTRDDLDGPFNASAPQPVTNAQFTKTLAHRLGRPALFTIPGKALELVLGERARLLLTGARMRPARLEEAGFKFRYNTLDEALGAILV
ncbi:TIGR01777 family oxidoreductase [Phytohalomonas tamaricis]|uniref:TIGR01777 family oxidoreductase n=1 Tax=Phytohalomonas tamaricis TaxID=2081032 RepID=UPI000D0B95D6|nr:TIGR01777 family oxidoreductase [Phytohalomonas tamaricis]